MYEAVQIIHVAAAAAWFGANVTQAVLAPRFRRESPAALAAWWRGTVTMGTLLYTPAAILLLLTGIWMVLDGPYTFGDTFVEIGIAVVIVGALLGMLVFGPQGRRAAEAVEAGDQTAGSLQRRLTAFGVLDTLLILLAITVMVLRLGAG